ncbi:MAG: Ubiquinone biosynthesis protein [Caeruleum heppii]|nr:MAG: Ubiquinone biosynthesis protein [Caeruleum heppii]
MTDMIAALGESTAQPYFISRLRQTMLSHPTGRRILRDRPRITSSTMSLSYLRTLPPDSLGRAYAAWLDAEGVTPDTRSQVRYVDVEEEAYVMQRYRECHDFYHALTGLPVVVEGEIAIKAFEFANTSLPMTGLSMFALARLKKDERSRFWSTYGPWAMWNGLNAKDLINVYWEEILERDVGEVRKELGVEIPADLRETRRLVKARKKAEREAREKEKHRGHG